jgi:hypothetical protein
MNKLLVSLLLVLGLTSAVANKTQPVQQGHWADGTSVLLQCPEQSRGQVRFIFKTADGTEYPGMFSCGESI